ncbi:hypothetical protein BV22DRAFT_1135000 [Leucogyrophana mollusca]|uniref:Uncharacterized protein n=1 Tax=Leucogyrophana mollusca TaxID=85980 RepID=A0ACB8AWL4_9AGAM|nr:hypothetical protein BV22DRAFT_1135000 [Leucogyrophana mollusca]
MDSEPHELNCWIYGDDVERIFPVMISKEPNFHDVDPRCFDLYRFSLPADEQVGNELKKWTPTKELRLGGWRQLSTLFPNSDSGECLIIVSISSSSEPSVVLPYMTLNYWSDAESRILKTRVGGYCSAPHAFHTPAFLNTSPQLHGRASVAQNAAAVWRNAAALGVHGP